MKSTVATIFSILIFYSMANAIELPSNISEYLGSSRLTEQSLPPHLNGDGKVFIEYVVTNRSAILDNFTAVTSNKVEEQLMIAAMEATPGSDYVQTLGKICDLREADTIDDDTFEFAIRATPFNRGFLAYNYQHPNVVTIVQRAQSLVPSDPEFQAYLTSILDGTQKTVIKRYFDIEGIPEPEVLVAP